MRLQKYLADAGIASRRKCEEIISAGRVKVNGHVAVLGSSVEPEDSVTLDDKPVRPADERIVIALSLKMSYVPMRTAKTGLKSPTFSANCRTDCTRSADWIMTPKD